MAGKNQKGTVAEVIRNQQSEVLETWLENIRALPGNRTLELMGEEQLRKEASGLLEALATAFGAGQYEDITAPEFADSITMLREMSASRARRGFTPSETATFVFSLKDALLQYLREEFAEDGELLNTESVKTNKAIDSLGLVTFESYAKTREEVIAQQQRSIMEIPTPVIQLWDETVLLPLVGVVDTARAQQIIEKLLQSIVEYEAQVAILDVTGVPAIDTRVAHHLMKTVSAAKMVGAQVVVTGVSPAAAQTMVRLGVDVSVLRTCGTLQAGIAEALAIVGKQVVSR